MHRCSEPGERFALTGSTDSAICGGDGGGGFDSPEDPLNLREGDSPWSVGSLKMFTDGIPTLPPGKEIRTLFDSSFQRDRAAWDDAYEVEIEYTDGSRRHQFREKIVLDLGIYWGLLRVEEKGLHDIHKRLEELMREARKWTASGGGLSVLTPRDQRDRVKRFEEAREEARAKRNGSDA